MKPKTMLDIQCKEATRFIKLPFFLNALGHSPLNKGSDITKEVFFLLLDKGLPLHFSEPGYCLDGEKIHSSDVKCALIRIDDALFETDVPRIKLFAQEIIATESKNKISMSDILIGREEVKTIYASMGFDAYPWVKIPWPESASDFEDYPIENEDKKQKHEDKKQKRTDKLLERYEAKFGQSFWKKAAHDDEFEMAFDVLTNPNLGELGISEHELTAILNKKIAPDASLLETQNAIAEMAALRPTFYAEYQNTLSSDLINQLKPLPENPSFEDRVKRFAWLNILKKRKAEVDNKPPSDARFKELEQLNQTIAIIHDQLGIAGVMQTDIEQSLLKEIKVPVDLEQSETAATAIPTRLAEDVEYVNQKQIKLIFDKYSPTQWRGYFSREKQNGLGIARRYDANKPEYSLDEVTCWLKKKGGYSEAEIKTAIQKYKEPSPNSSKEDKSAIKKNLGHELQSLMIPKR